jgi:predicted small integral membrane protein
MKRLALGLAALVLLATPARAQNQVEEPILQWMAWTWQTGTFFAVIATALVCMTLWEILRPGGAPRTPGALGISTTRGDRLFISLLSAAYIHLGWLGLVSAPLWGATLISLVLMLAVFRWV